MSTTPEATQKPAEHGPAEIAYWKVNVPRLLAKMQEDRERVGWFYELILNRTITPVTQQTAKKRRARSR